MQKILFPKSWEKKPFGLKKKKKKNFNIKIQKFLPFFWVGICFEFPGKKICPMFEKKKKANKTF
ncbi:hypothetical protein [Lactococcus cremoris]|uniref:hypothetical protein n=1 Tax=Lactococcus lactis subsp. cremoris TaxID=1359 RepID=UPI000582E3F5|nr:hypothetical protein [Lactococcus cremoris]KGH33260.1 hypothetical protein JL36_08425 [Lactococcus cremoris]